MKKIFSLVVAAIFSVTMFAQLTPAPTVAELEAYGDPTTDVILAVHFDVPVCNEIVFTGGHNGWTTDPEADNMVYGQTISGKEGWYVFRATWQENLEAKPVALNVNGGFDWNNQGGGPDAWQWIGGNAAEISGGDESKMFYLEPGVYIYECKYFKNHADPCAAIEQHRIVIYPPSNCTDVIPGVCGSFTGWSSVLALEADVDDDDNDIYFAVVQAAAGATFKFTEAGKAAWANELNFRNEETGEYAHGGDLTLSADDAENVFHFEDAQWDMCGEVEQTFNITVKAPACFDATAPALVGSYNDWDVTADNTVVLAKQENGTYTGTLTALVGSAVKVVAEKTESKEDQWNNQIQTLKEADAEHETAYWGDVADFKLPAEADVVIDYSDANLYKWTICEVEAGIEEIVVEKSAVAKKVIVDGQLFIMHEGRLINVLGAQVK